MTSAAVQQQLGYFEPNFGHLFGDREFVHGDSIPKNTLIQPRGEGEIAFVLGKDLAQANIRFSDVIVVSSMRFEPLPQVMYSKWKSVDSVAICDETRLEPGNNASTIRD